MVPPETDVHLIYKVKWIKVIIGTPHKSSLRALSLVVEIGFLGPQRPAGEREKQRPMINTNSLAKNCRGLLWVRPCSCGDGGQ